jgi:hypothetical protein
MRLNKGDRFSFRYLGEKYEGEVQQEKDVKFLCHNCKEMRGQDAFNKKGYLYSWSFTDFYNDMGSSSQITEFKLISSGRPPESPESPKLFEGSYESAKILDKEKNIPVVNINSILKPIKRQVLPPLRVDIE